MVLETSSFTVCIGVTAPPLHSSNTHVDAASEPLVVRGLGESVQLVDGLSQHAVRRLAAAEVALEVEDLRLESVAARRPGRASAQRRRQVRLLHLVHLRRGVVALSRGTRRLKPTQ